MSLVMLDDMTRLIYIYIRICVYIYIYIHIHIYIYISMYRQAVLLHQAPGRRPAQVQEQGRRRPAVDRDYISLSLYIYIYIYMYI